MCVHCWCVVESSGFAVNNSNNKVFLDSGSQVHALSAMLLLWQLSKSCLPETIAMATSSYAFVSLIVSAGDLFLLWMGMMFAAFLYSAVTIPLRASFDLYRYLPAMVTFFVVDYVCDVLYVMDMVLVQSHLSFCKNGVLEVCV